MTAHDSRTVKRESEGESKRAFGYEGGEGDVEGRREEGDEEWKQEEEEKVMGNKAKG